MRKVVMLNRVTVDGYYAGPGGSIDWFVRDPEVDKAAHDLVDADTALLGRVTYQMFERVWPAVAADPDAPKQARVLADELTRMTKVVFTRSMTEAGWENTTLVAEDPVEHVRRLRAGDGAGMIIFGSGKLVQPLAGAGLIDEYLVVLSPVALGAGQQLFAGGDQLDLELVDTRNFDSGNVLVRYRPRRSG